MTTELVLLYLFIGGLIGALITPLVYWAKGRKPASGFFAGVVTGAVGNLLLLLPLWILLPRRRVVSPFDFNIRLHAPTRARCGHGCIWRILPPAR
jgi:hypothetical protein